MVLHIKVFDSIQRQMEDPIGDTFNEWLAGMVARGGISTDAKAQDYVTSYIEAKMIGVLEAASRVAAVNSAAQSAQTQHLTDYVGNVRANDHGRTRWDRCKALQTWSKFLVRWFPERSSVKVAGRSDCSPECLSG